MKLLSLYIKRAQANYVINTRPYIIFTLKGGKIYYCFFWLDMVIAGPVYNFFEYNTTNYFLYYKQITLFIFTKEMEGRTLVVGGGDGSI